MTSLFEASLMHTRRAGLKRIEPYPTAVGNAIKVLYMRQEQKLTAYAMGLEALGRLNAL